MKLIKIIGTIIRKIYNFYLYYKTYRYEIKNINKKQNLVKKVKLNQKQEQEIKNFYLDNYGKQISTKWHRLYQSYTGIYNKDYFPEIIFSTELEPLLCDRAISKQLTDKSLVELLYSNIDKLYIPKTIILNCSGVWYDGNRNIITREKAFKILENTGRRVIKKTIDSSSGRDVMIINIKDAYDIKNNLSLEELIEKFNDNFIVQEVVENSKEISQIYPKSLNTFRVMTYIIEGKLYHMPITMRIGKGDKEVDNIHAGGMFINVSDKGVLNEKAFTEYQNVYTEHPDTKFVFKGHRISGIKEMIEIAYKCHSKTPHLKLISWDFTINKKNQVTLIEVNLDGQSIWFPQMASGKSAFGENTKYMLNLLKQNKSGK